jgi:hypothetical protein
MPVTVKVWFMGNAPGCNESHSLNLSTVARSSGKAVGAGQGPVRRAYFYQYLANPGGKWP